jgi:hypothetical protein
MRFTIQQWLPWDSLFGGKLTYCDGARYPKQPAIPININKTIASIDQTEFGQFDH